MVARMKRRSSRARAWRVGDWEIGGSPALEDTMT